jgi:hypothetical protein
VLTCQAVKTFGKAKKKLNLESIVPNMQISGNSRNGSLKKFAYNLSKNYILFLN